MTDSGNRASAITWRLSTMAVFLAITAWCRFKKSSRTLEVISQPRVTPEGKAKADSKAQSACGG